MNSTLTDVLQFIETLQHHTDMHSAWDCFLGYARQFGFTNGGLADMPGPGEKLEQTILCLSWPDGWSKRYFEQNYIANDPARLHLRRTVEPFTWGEMTACKAYSKMQRTIVHEASEFRMTSGIIFPMLGLRGGPAMITVAGDNQELCETDRLKLHMAAIYTHAVIRRVVRDCEKVAALPSFSKRERECLQWYAAGKSDWEIGEILSISQKSANTYLERAKQKFRVSTRKQLIVEALSSGVIQF